MILSPTETLIEIRDERQLKAMTGMTPSQLELLTQEFAQVEAETRQAKYEHAVLTGRRTRQLGGGRQGILTTSTSKVLFILVYGKTYPTYDDLGSRFGMSKSAAFDNLGVYFPLVQEALARLGVLPHRTFQSIDEFRDTLAGVEEIIMDVTERRQARPKDPAPQKDCYSGKKNMHTAKNTVIVTVTTFIWFLGQTFGGRHQDYKIFPEEFSTAEAWFEHLRVLVDLGYQGIRQDDEGQLLQIPFKKPRKSKKPPHPALTAEPTESNKELSRIRIRVEHALSGLKRFNLLVNRFRGRKPNFIDDVIVRCAGLWNLNLLPQA
jgi:hypothetical protein